MPGYGADTPSPRDARTAPSGSFPRTGPSRWSGQLTSLVRCRRCDRATRTPREQRRAEWDAGTSLPAKTRYVDATTGQTQGVGGAPRSCRFQGVDHSDRVHPRGHAAGGVASLDGGNSTAGWKAIRQRQHGWVCKRLNTRNRFRRSLETSENPVLIGRARRRRVPLCARRRILRFVAQLDPRVGRALLSCWDALLRAHGPGPSASAKRVPRDGHGVSLSTALGLPSLCAGWLECCSCGGLLFVRSQIPASAERTGA